MNLFASPEVWLGLLTLTVLEIVLGIDNIIFISILAGKLPAAQQARARRVGLAGAMVTRIALLAALAWIIRLTAPLFHVLGRPFSGRDLILIAGGLFLLAKSTRDPRGPGGRVGSGWYARARSVRRRRRTDRPARYRVFARLGDHRRRHGETPRRDDRRRGSGGGRHDVRGDADQ